MFWGAWDNTNRAVEVRLPLVCVIQKRKQTFVHDLLFWGDFGGDCKNHTGVWVIPVYNLGFSTAVTHTPVRLSPLLWSEKGQQHTITHTKQTQTGSYIMMCSLSRPTLQRKAEQRLQRINRGSEGERTKITRGKCQLFLTVPNVNMSLLMMTESSLARKSF